MGRLRCTAVDRDGDHHRIVRVGSPNLFQCGVSFVSVPILQSLLLADHVYRDQATGKHIICGVFSTIFFTPNPPAANPSGNTDDKLESDGGSKPAGNGAAQQPIGSDSAGLPSESRPDRGSASSTPPGSKAQPIQNLMQAGSPYVYFSVTELTGRKSFEVRYSDLRENRILFQAEVPIECDDPLKTIEVAMPLPRLPLSGWDERVYALEIVCEGQLLGSHRVLARITPKQPPS